MKKKSDFKKLALMGITGGVMLASSASAEQNSHIENVNQLLAGGCKTLAASCRQGCQNIAYQPIPQQSCQNSGNIPPQGYTTAMPPQQGCQNSGPSRQACQAIAYQPPHQGCQSSAPGNYNPNWNQQASSQGCQSRTGCQSSPMNSTAVNNPMQMPPQNGNMPPRPGQPTIANPQQQSSRDYSQWESGKYTADLSKNSVQVKAPESISGEAQLLSQLNDEGRAIYSGLDPAGKALAIKLANQSCAGKNDCKGLNSCKSKDHSCAGKGSCKGTSPGPFKDKNQAVKIAAQKMAEKRAQTSTRY